MSNYKTVTYTWQELFDKVWERPLLQIAEDIGVSDVALGKACRKAGIPLPGRGYWAKSDLDRDGLRHAASSSSTSATISFDILKSEFAANPRATSPRRVVVPEKLTSPHPLIVRTSGLARKKDAYNGRVHLRRTNALDIRVSPKALDRALRIMDTIIKSTLAISCTWEVTDDNETKLTCDGIPMTVCLRERLSKEQSTGELTFSIEDYFATPIRRRWGDTNSITLEEKLAHLVAELPAAAKALKQQRDEHDAKMRQWEKERERERQERRKQEAQRRLRSRLVRTMIRWERATRINRFCDAVQAQADPRTGLVEQAVNDWIVWARKQAELLNPLESELSDFTSLYVKVPDFFKGLEDYEKPDPDWWTR